MTHPQVDIVSAYFATINKMAVEVQRMRELRETGNVTIVERRRLDTEERVRRWDSIKEDRRSRNELDADDAGLPLRHEGEL